MTLEELKQRYELLVERVEKKKASLSKLCKKVGQDYNNMMDSFNSYIENYDGDFIRLETCKELLDVKENPNQWDSNGRAIMDVFDYNDEVYSLAEGLKKLYELIVSQRKALDKLNNAEAKDAHAKEDKIKVIWDFLTEWETKAYEWHLKNAEKYSYLKKNYNEEWLKYKNEHEDVKSYFLKTRFEETYYYGISPLTTKITTIKTHYRNDTKSYEYDYYDVNTKLLREELAKEKQAKYDDLIKRVQEVVGDITDASYLSIGNNGEINGVITGTKGKATVKTISAGGYNIQRFHYRVLVHKI